MLCWLTWHYQLVLSLYLHQLESGQLSFNRVTQFQTTGPIDRTPGTPGSDNKLLPLETLLQSIYNWFLNVSDVVLGGCIRSWCKKNLWHHHSELVLVKLVCVWYRCSDMGVWSWIWWVVDIYCSISCWSLWRKLLLCETTAVCGSIVLIWVPCAVRIGRWDLPFHFMELKLQLGPLALASWFTGEIELCATSHAI